MAKGAGVAGATRVALYVHVNTDEQKRDRFSLAERRRTLKQDGEPEDFVMADEGLPGTSPYGPGPGRVLELAQERAVNLVLAAERDRFFRGLLTSGAGSSATSPGSALSSSRWTISTKAWLTAS